MGAAGAPWADETVPDLPCACVDLARKDAITDVLALGHAALDPATAPTDNDAWRRHTAKVITRLRGLQ